MFDLSYAITQNKILFTFNNVKNNTLYCHVAKGRMSTSFFIIHVTIRNNIINSSFKIVDGMKNTLTLIVT